MSHVFPLVKSGVATRRHPPHHLSTARANPTAGQDPEARLSRPSHHSNAPIKHESKSILSKIVALTPSKGSPQPVAAAFAPPLKICSTTARWMYLPMSTSTSSTGSTPKTARPDPHASNPGGKDLGASAAAQRYAARRHGKAV